MSTLINRFQNIANDKQEYVHYHVSLVFAYICFTIYRGV